MARLGLLDQEPQEGVPVDEVLLVHRLENLEPANEARSGAVAASERERCARIGESGRPSLSQIAIGQDSIRWRLVRRHRRRRGRERLGLGRRERAVRTGNLGELLPDELVDDGRPLASVLPDAEPSSSLEGVLLS